MCPYACLAGGVIITRYQRRAPVNVRAHGARSVVWTQVATNHTQVFLVDGGGAKGESRLRETLERKPRIPLAQREDKAGPPTKFTSHTAPGHGEGGEVCGHGVHVVALGEGRSWLNVFCRPSTNVAVTRWECHLPGSPFQTLLESLLRFVTYRS
ncbi:hypothetical protein BaRGS_00001822 [Batillaria attramentaria]|uniref:Uncharacterized protein n=1 Tax=Batillaria attramentaria TaxID=370345 RepID=A0ABD0M6I5_9CAEN